MAAAWRSDVAADLAALALLVVEGAPRVRAASMGNRSAMGW